MKDLEFTIDAWAPDTIPQSRLGQYLVELSKLYGEPDSVRFVKVRKGSAVLVSSVSEQAKPKVQRRLLELRSGVAPKEAVEAFKKIDDMLALDNATGTVRGLGQEEIVQFPGRERPKIIDYGSVREDGFIEGEIVRIGGRDHSVHITLQDGATIYTSIETDRDMARRLGQLIYGPTVRLWGTGTWRRSAEGGWTLDRFIVARFEAMSASMHDAIDTLQGIGGSLWNEDPDPVGGMVSARRQDDSDGPRRS